MKKILLPLLLLFTLCSCKDDVIDSSALYGHWVLISNAKDGALILVFDDEEVSVSNAAWDYRPFTSNVSWEYYVDNDSVLHLSRYVGTDEDGSSEYDYLNFDLSFSENYNRLTLYYDPLIGSLRHFTFAKR